MNSSNKECSQSERIELFLLKKLPAQLDYQKIDKHRQSCKYCKELFFELEDFYKNFAKQLQKPVANSTFKLLHDIEDDKVIIAGILLKPQLLDENPGERHFISVIILSTYNPEPTNLDELDYILLGKDEILIRAIQSTITHETTLFLYAENQKLYSDITLKIPKIEKTFMSDNKGKVDIGNLEINSLNDLDVAIISK